MKRTVSSIKSKQGRHGPLVKKFLATVMMSVLLVSVVSAPVYAVVRSNSTVVVGVDEVIDDDFFVSGDEIIIEGTVNGDVYAAANKVSIRGTVNGDVFAGASTIDVSGIIRDDLRVGANSVSLVGAQIGDSITMGGNDLSIDSGSVVGGGLLFGGRSLSIDGSIGRGIMMGGQTSRIDGSVGRTTRIAAEDVTIGSDAVIDGDLEYESDKEAVIDGRVTGKIVRGDGDSSLDSQSFLKATALGFSIWAFVGAIVVAGVLILMFPNIFRRADEKLAARPWAVIGKGLLVFLAVIPVIVLLFVTVVGIPFGLVVMMLWFLSIYFAKFFTAYAVGSRIVGLVSSGPIKTAGKAFTAILVGLVLYYVLRQIPTAGMLVRFLTTIVGLGMIAALYKRHPMKHVNEKKK